eukprot:TRINITY_DN9548_c0_g1_i4.p3 TRINITY_DN9548_c0_g1~~TRINITY_DN9548_c0_g1_i4.p3  ORF type:complete len:106 (+),score=28.40 TRINITY_DN9548_c0_g1_i4:13-330(+)
MIEVVVDFFFFFQAEDGIRDFCLSRGLGDVYKRQENELLKPIFTQLSPKGNVADFDWNLESDWNILSTYQDGENEYDSGGGYLHVFRPLQMVRDGRDEDLSLIHI